MRKELIMTISKMYTCTCIRSLFLAHVFKIMERLNAYQHVSKI